MSTVMNKKIIYHKNKGSLFKIKAISLAVICALYVNESQANWVVENQYCKDPNSTKCEFDYVSDFRFDGVFESPYFDIKVAKYNVNHRYTFPDFMNDKDVVGNYFAFDGNKDNKHQIKNSLVFMSIDRYENDLIIIDKGGIETLNNLGFINFEIKKDIAFNFINIKNVRGGGGYFSQLTKWSYIKRTTG